MDHEFAQRLPRTDSMDPGERDEDGKPNDLAGLDVGVVEQRLEPPARVEWSHREGPSVRRIPDDGRLDPDHVEQQVRGHSESYESQSAKLRDEAEREDREQEEKRVSPDARVEPGDIRERFVDQIREDRSEEDQAIIDSGRRFPGEEPREAESNPQMAKQQHPGSSRQPGWRHVPG